ncbi:MAG: helix-turn-helix domain-containing protein [Enhydrobacter sp.]|nr:MAG: helix-turn-helix domain-containing protein [Enhydrobacter sp.]
MTKAKKLTGQPKFTSLEEVEGEVLATRPDVRKIWDETASRRSLSMKLVGLRRSAGLAQSDIAARTGWDKAFVSRLESARGGFPDIATVNRYAEVCGATVGFVFASPIDATHVRIVDAVALDFKGGGAHPDPFEGLKDTQLALNEAYERDGSA